MRNYRELTDEELLELERLYPVTPNRTLAKQFDISVDGLQDYVAYPRGWKKDRKSVLIGNRGGKSLTEKQEAWIMRHYNVEYGDDTCYYTSETKRHPKMEQNAPKYGLKVEPWEETTF